MAETCVAAIVGGIYLTWFMICFIHQLPHLWVRRLSQYDLLGLLPNWRFFAPKPFAADYHLVLRYLNEEGRGPHCMEITDVLPMPSRPMSALWNPHKRLHFGYIDAVIDLVNRAKLLTVDEVEGTLPYWTIANFVAAYVPDRGIRAVQFIVVAADGYRQREAPIVVFVSKSLIDGNLYSSHGATSKQWTRPQH